MTATVVAVATGPVVAEVLGHFEQGNQLVDWCIAAGMAASAHPAKVQQSIVQKCFVHSLSAVDRTQAEHWGTLVRYSDHSVGFDFGFGFAMNDPKMATTCRKSWRISQIVGMPVVTALERCPFSSRVPKKRVAARLW